MNALIDYFTSVISKIYSIVDVRIFPDFPVTYIQLIISCVVIGYIFKFVFGGLKETELQFNHINNQITSQVSKKMNNSNRRKQVNENASNE